MIRGVDGSIIYMTGRVRETFEIQKNLPTKTFISEQTFFGRRLSYLRGLLTLYWCHMAVNLPKCPYIWRLEPNSFFCLPKKKMAAVGRIRGRIVKNQGLNKGSRFLSHRIQLMEIRESFFQKGTKTIYLLV